MADRLKCANCGQEIEQVSREGSDPILRHALTGSPACDQDADFGLQAVIADEPYLEPAVPAIASEPEPETVCVCETCGLVLTETDDGFVHTGTSLVECGIEDRRAVPRFLPLGSTQEIRVRRSVEVTKEGLK